MRNNHAIAILIVSLFALTIPARYASATPQGDTAPSAPVAPSPAPVAPVVAPDSYILDTGDSVLITVDRHPDVSRTVPLLADATVLLPRMDRPIVARGLTCAQLAEGIRKSLNNPRALVLQPGQVTVTVQSMRQRHVYVRGNAVHGSDVDLQNGWRVSELVATMGGVPQPDRVRVTLINPKRPAAMTVDLQAALSDETGPANIPLREGDTLIFDGPGTKILFIKGEGPRGKQEIDERFTLKQALISLGISKDNATGELRKAVLYRHTVPGDPTSPTTEEHVDLVNILTQENTDHDLKDYDTLEIPLSLRYYYVWGELGGARKRYLPEDRKTYLLDVMSDSGSTTAGQAKIGDVTILRGTDTPKPSILHYDYGKFLRSGDPRDNPEIQPQDVVFVPNVKRVDPVSTIWTGFGLYQILKTLAPGLP